MIFKNFQGKQILSQGTVEPPISVGKAYNLIMENGEIVNIARKSGERFGFTIYKQDGEDYIPYSAGEIMDSTLRKGLDKIL